MKRNNMFLKLVVTFTLLCTISIHVFEKSSSTVEAATKVDVNRLVKSGYKMNHGYEFTYVNSKNQKSVVSPSSIGEYCTTYYNDRNCFFESKENDSYFVETNLVTKKKEYVVNISNSKETSLWYNGAPEDFYQLPMPIKKGNKFKTYKSDVAWNNEVLSTTASVTLDKKTYSNVLLVKSTTKGKVIQSYYVNDLGLLLQQDTTKKPYKNLFKLVSYKKKSIQVKNKITSGYKMNGNYTYLYTSTDGDIEYTPTDMESVCENTEDCEIYKESFSKEGGTSIFDIRSLPYESNDERFYNYAFSTSNQKELALANNYTTYFKYSMPVNEGQLYKNTDEFGDFVSKVLSTSYKLRIDEKMYTNVMVVSIIYDESDSPLLFYLDKEAGLLMIEMKDMGENYSL